MSRFGLLTVLCCVLGSVPAVAGLLDADDEAQLLPAAQAFDLDLVALRDQTLHLHWHIAPGYYLYRQRIRVELLAPTDSGLAPIRLPAGDDHEDEHFGKVQIYRDSLLAEIPLTRPPQSTLDLRITSQGCADIGVCYPPHTVLRRIAAPRTDSP